uniref:Uncharacterized protein n=1 Tax=Rhizophora mucronata TaxID=61149 RepID=A0A2P2NIY0_RHIMU
MHADTKTLTWICYGFTSF